MVLIKRLIFLDQPPPAPSLTKEGEFLAPDFLCKAGQGGAFIAVHVEVTENNKRLFYGDTCWWGPKGWEVL